MNKQTKIYKYLTEKDGASLKEIADAMPWDYYYNRMKHFGEITSRMVKKGWITRTKIGYFKIIKRPIQKLPFDDLPENQIEIEFTE